MLRFGLIGAGAVARIHAEQLRSASHARLVAIADTDREAAQRLAKPHGCASFGCVNDLVRAVGLDAAIICTPPSAHQVVMEQLIEEGVHVLCEKPFTLTADSSQVAIETAAAKGCQLAMASKFRYVPAVQEARRLLGEGCIGKPELYESVFSCSVDMSESWHSDVSVSGGGVLADNGPHAADLMRFLLGPVTGVSAVEGPRVNGLPVDETVNLTSRTVDDVPARLFLSWSVIRPLDHFVRIHGSEGTLKIGWKQSTRRRHGETTWHVFGEGYDKKECFSAMLDNFVRAVRGEEDLLITAEDTLASVDFVNSAYRSLPDGEWIEIPWRTRSPRG